MTGAESMSGRTRCLAFSVDLTDASFLLLKRAPPLRIVTVPALRDQYPITDLTSCGVAVAASMMMCDPATARSC